MSSATTEERFWPKVHRAAADECWPWMAGKDSKGYGQFRVSTERKIVAHRFAYEALVGPILDGLVLDHLCRNRACCNPAHLEPVPSRTNTLRGFGPTAQRARQTHCVNGHEFTPENTRANRRGGRLCRTCDNARRRLRRAAADAANIGGGW